MEDKCHLTLKECFSFYLFRIFFYLFTIIYRYQHWLSVDLFGIVNYNLGEHIIEKYNKANRKGVNLKLYQMNTGKIFFTLRFLLHSGHFFLILIDSLMQAPQKMCPQFVECGCLPTDESMQTAQMTVFSWRSVSFGTAATGLTIFCVVGSSFLNREFSLTGSSLDVGPLLGEHKFITSPTTTTLV